MSDLTMTIGGSAVPTAGTFDVVNPATGQVFATAPDCTREQLDAAYDSAAKAFRDWRVDIEARRAALLAAADVLDANAAEVAALLTTEQGKPLSGSAGELRGSAAWLRYFATLDIPREVIQDDERGFAEVVRRPLGVVGGITPWNFPLSLAFWKIAPALLAGNTMVLKPSPFTPLATLKVGELLRGVFPEGVLNVITGTNELGAWMTAHPVPRKISFTGSIETGKRVAEAAAKDLKRVTLELGGNDPAIVLDDVDPQAVANRLFTLAFANNGQVCMAVKRVYVPEALYDDVVEALAERAKAAKVGNGAEEGTELGPLNNKPQFDRIKDLVDDAVAGGAVAVAGGKPIDGPGYFFQPTIVANIADGSRLVDEEQFGPALPVISYRNVDEVVDRANATQFGLGGSVWGADVDRANAIADRLETGTSWVNAHLVVGPHQPFGGAKWSGIGVENGPWGLYGFTELKVQYQAR